jgi:hypothetical protein
LYALKGNKSLELWRYVPGTPDAGRSTRHARAGVQEDCTMPTGDCKLQIVRNPAVGTATIRWSLPPTAHASLLSLYDASGRLVYRRAIDSRHSSLDIALAPGVYLLRVTGNTSLTRKLVVE